MKRHDYERLIYLSGSLKSLPSGVRKAYRSVRPNLELRVEIQSLREQVRDRSAHKILP